MIKNKKKQMTYADIVAIRKDLGLSVRAFCDLIGIAFQTYYSFKSVRNPKGSLVILLRLIQNHPEEMFVRLREVQRDL